MKYTLVSFFIFLATIFFFPVLAQQTPQPPAEKIYISVEEMPQFPGGQDSMMAYIGRNTRYPQEAQRNNEQGVSILSFVITASGNVTQPQILKSASPSLDAEALRVVNSMPTWVPGKQNGQPVAVRFNLPVRFQFASDEDIARYMANNSNLPTYPGGEAAMFKFIAKNLQYPPEARKNKIEGVSVISFIVEEDGSMGKYKIEKPLGYGTDEEAIKLLQRMPKWNPAKQNGVPVRVKFTMPIKFSL